MLTSAKVRALRYLVVGVAMLSAYAGSTAIAATATIEAGEKTVSKGELAEFKVSAPRDTSSELSAWCEVTAGGAAKLTFDGEHYIPLSDPAVGDAVTLKPGETKRFELTGTIEKNRGDAYIGFLFADVPQAMCFPGMECGGATGGAESVKVSCGNR